MNCPMTFSDQRSGTEHDCVREKCAWWVVKFASIGKRMPDAAGCAVAFIAANGMQVAYINSGESTEEKR